MDMRPMKIRKKILREFHSTIELHEKVQTQVLDLVYLNMEEVESPLKNPIRITAGEAENRLKRLAEQYDIQGIVRALES